MAKKPYNFLPELKSFEKQNVPINAKILPATQKMMKVLYKLEKSDENVKVSELKIPTCEGRSCRILVYESRKEKTDDISVVYFHGGGFVFEAAPHHFTMARRLAEKINGKVFLVDYSLAPKNKFPAAAEDAFAAYQWIEKHAKKLAINEEKIVVAGDSAGGNLAAVVSMMARDKNIQLPYAQMLLYPVIDRRMETESMKLFVDTPMCNTKDMEEYFKLYLSCDRMDTEKIGAEWLPYLSPIEADTLEGLPPAYIEVAEYDCLRDEGIQYAEQLKLQGVETELHEIKGAMHGYDIAVESPLIQKCIEQRAGFMKNMKKRVLMTGLVGAMAFSALQMQNPTEIYAAEEKTVDVMFVHDTHSHLNEFTTVENGESQILGGFAKLKTLIHEQKEKNPATLLLDAGDFSMGTLIQVVFEEEASEVRMLGELGFEVTTFGNHEFDYKAKGLANMMNNAVESGDPLPAIAVCNVDWASMEKAGLTEDQQLLYDAFENYGVKDYVMLEKDGVNIAVTGVFGIDSLDCAPNCPLEFKNPVEAVKETVAEIEGKEDVDMIVCVSHSGTSENEDKSEDEILAKSVPELDLIISGHSHTKLEAAIVHGDTSIVSAGEYGKYLGSLSMTQKENGRWKLDSYELLSVDEAVAADKETQKKVDALIEMVDSKYLKQFGFTKDEVLATNEVTFVPNDDLYTSHKEENLGSLIADAYAYAAENFSDDDTHPVDVAVAPAGTIRDTYALGNITTEMVYNSFSLGIGEDGIPGYPLLSVYLTGKELKLVAEIDASVSDLMQAARLYTNGLCWSYNPNRMILNKATDAWLLDASGNRVELEDEKLYRVVTDFYTSQMLAGVTDLSYGLLSLVPKFADGTPVENYEDAILMSGTQELKAWVAIAEYMKSFEDTDGDGIANVPEKYAAPEGRKIVENSKNIIELVKNPNKFFFMIIGIVLLALVIVVVVVLLVIKFVRFLLKKRSRH